MAAAANGAYEAAMAHLEAIPHLAVVVPTLLGLIIASRRSLRNWTAIQQAPIDTPVARSSIPRHVFAVIAVLALVGAAEYLVLATAHASDVLRPVAYAMQASSLFAFTAYITGALQLKVVRPAGGIPRLVSIHEPKARAKVFGLVATSIIMTYASFELPAFHPASMFGAIALLVHLSSSGAPAPTITLRAMTIGVVCGEVLVLMLSALVACGAITLDLPLINALSANEPSADGDESFSLLSGVIVESGFSRIVIATWAMWPALLISVARRFDYDQHLKRGGQPLAAVELLDTGAALVPRRQRQCGFKRPYFRVVLASLAATMYVVAQYGERVGITAKDDLVFMLAVLLVGQPIASVAIWALAVMRGETDAAWAYKEVWLVPSDAGAIALPADEALPEYVAIATDEKIEA